MSGICGICESGFEMAPSRLGSMLSALALPDESPRDSVGGISAALGVTRRWPFQQVGAIPGARIACDADLLNEKEWTDRLTQQGLEVSQMSLAERLAWLYALEGPEFVKHLRGVFAIAVWDEKTQRLVLAIDRLGVKGLYWSQENNRVLFASRAGAICAARHEPPQVNPAAVMQFLLFSVVPAPLAIYHGMEKLRPGYLLIWENGRVRQQQYWDLEYAETETHDERYWAREVREGMRAAVHRHLEGCQGDNTGAYLSGGTDSSSVAAFMSERFSPAHTFSISFEETPYNEIGYARITANRFGTRHHEYCVSAQDALEAIPKITQYYDEPFANSSAIGALYCAQMARENGVETLLAGDGGDELFAGNERYAGDKRFALYHSLPAWLRRGALEPAAELLPANGSRLSLLGRYVRRARIPNPRRLYSYGVFLNTPPGEAFDADFLAQAPPESWMEIAEAHFRAPRTSSELNRQLYLDVKLVLADNDLRKVAGTAELAGVRARFPLLDHELAELSGRIPTRLKLKGFQKRYIFKRAMEGILPDEVLHKKKHGFGVPLGLWLLQDARLNSLMRDVLCDARTRQRGYFRPKFLDQLLNERHHEHAGFYGEVVWYLVALELWHREHLESRQGSPCAT